MTIFYAIILLGILIFVHELGHFLFAKMVNVKVLKFSLGFGPRVLGKKYGETEYQISAVPLGGYVKMLGEEPGDEISDEDRARAYNLQPVGKRILIVLAGPVFNILFAAILFIALFLAGIPVARPYIGKIAEQSPAANAGLMTGDKVVAINGIAVESWDDIDASTNKNPGKPLLFRIEREGTIAEIPVTPVKKSEKNIFGEEREVWDIGIVPLIPSEIGEVVKGSSADKAGLKKGDRVIEIEGKTIKMWQDLTAIIHESPGKSLRFRIKRDDHTMELSITPERSTFTMPTGERKEIGLIGVRPMTSDFMKRFNLIDATNLGIRKTWETSFLTFVVVIKLIQRIVPADTLGGPIMIFQMAGEQAALGAMSFFAFMAVLSINLGVLNLLPIPILDGGHVMFLTFEAIRRKPLSERVMMIAQKVGLMFIVTLMAFVLYNDFLRIVLPWLKKILSI
jgi:regulator of sigma E protease